MEANSCLKPSLRQIIKGIISEAKLIGQRLYNLGISI